MASGIEVILTVSLDDSDDDQAKIILSNEHNYTTKVLHDSDGDQAKESEADNNATDLRSLVQLDECVGRRWCCRCTRPHTPLAASRSQGSL